MGIFNLEVVASLIMEKVESNKDNKKGLAQVTCVHMDQDYPFIRTFSIVSTNHRLDSLICLINYYEIIAHLAPKFIKVT